ncbi:hypothetical protein QF035_004647 [Streptomyces umbrinus]|uniref:Integral membrane protein n=1 Tax=Streptomyces umbrinus TaxID=67370 RepID=A0ABU0SU26_9ACTN|nr:hypothetical protein [Streptomyces umbrinus]MDQ1027065.1 hypothetical protein [Streptomyces umbrinus]
MVDIIALACTLILGAIGIYYAREAILPLKRQISYRILSRVPLINQGSISSGRIVVTHNCVVLQNPHVLVVSLTNTGRHEVASDYFDQGKPLTFELSTPVIDLTSMTGRTLKIIRPQGTVIPFGPELMKRRQVVTFTALPEGEPHLAVHDYIIDTKVIDGSTRTVQRRRVLMGLIGAAFLIAATAVTIGVFFLR